MSMVLLSGTLSFARAQELFRGIVADSATFNAIPYVTVQVKHQHRGTSTDLQGNFVISAQRTDTLVFSMVGYKSYETALYDWEPSMILLAEHVTMLNTVTVNDKRIDNPYEGMFDEQNEEWKRLHKKLPFYMSKGKKEKIQLHRLEEENIRVKTYVDVIINTPEIKDGLVRKYHLTDEQYYATLGRFNEKYYLVMYYLTAGELISLLNEFYQQTYALGRHK